MSALDTPPPDFDRHADALVIAEAGACNPAGIAATLHQACRQVVHEGRRQADDPAVRLISLQLAFVTNVGRVLDPADYARLIDDLPLPRGRTRPTASPPDPARPRPPPPRGGAARRGQVRPADAGGDAPRRPAGGSTHSDSENAMLDATPAADVSARPQLPPGPPRNCRHLATTLRRGRAHRRGPDPAPRARSRPAPRRRNPP